MTADRSANRLASRDTLMATAPRYVVNGEQNTIAKHHQYSYATNTDSKRQDVGAVGIRLMTMYTLYTSCCADD